MICRMDIITVGITPAMIEAGIEVFTGHDLDDLMIDPHYPEKLGAVLAEVYRAMQERQAFEQAMRVGHATFANAGTTIKF
jgi:hypothetical protein